MENGVFIFDELMRALDRSLQGGAGRGGPSSSLNHHLIAKESPSAPLPPFNPLPKSHSLLSRPPPGSSVVSLWLSQSQKVCMFFGNVQGVLKARQSDNSHYGIQWGTRRWWKNRKGGFLTVFRWCTRWNGAPYELFPLRWHHVRETATMKV